MRRDGPRNISKCKEGIPFTLIDGNHNSNPILAKIPRNAPVSYEWSDSLLLFIFFVPDERSFS
jgi:hypothetical protein